MQQCSGDKREQYRGAFVTAGEAGLFATWLGCLRRVDADGGARHGSADLRGGEWSVDGGVDRVLGATQRPVNSDCRGAAEAA